MGRATKPPVFLNLLRIRQPVNAVASILHRISGVLLFLAIPGWLYLLDLSLADAAGYARAAEILAHPLAKLLGLIVFWSLCHHLLAGIRYLLLDLDVGIRIQRARQSAWIVNVTAPVLALLLTVVVL